MKKKQSLFLLCAAIAASAALTACTAAETEAKPSGTETQSTQMNVNEATGEADASQTAAETQETTAPYPALTEAQETLWEEKTEEYLAYKAGNAALCQVTAYYEVIGRTEQSIPVVLSMKAEEAEAFAGGEWNSVSPDQSFNSADHSSWCYGSISVENLIALLRDGTAAYLLADETVNASDILNTDCMDTPTKTVRFYQHYGEVCLIVTENGTAFEGASYPE